MANPVFEFQSYKEYLLEHISEKPGRGHGFKSSMAQAMKCQPGFVSKVLRKDSAAHFSLEQAAQLSSLMEHSKEEAHFFLLMVQYNRAGTEELRRYFRDQMKSVISHRLVLKNRLKNDRALSYEDEARYYSAWYYQAIRCAVAVPALRTKEALSKRFGITSKKTGDALDFLLSRGLVELKNGQYFPGIRHMHLAEDSAMRIKLHTNWRIRSLSALDEEKAKDLHYSGVITISENDALKIKSMLVDSIEEVLKRVRPSPEETVYSMCLDFFEL